MQNKQFIKNLLTHIHQKGLCKKISSIILGGSAVHNSKQVNDIDLLLICENKYGQYVYESLLNLGKEKQEIKNRFDIKILELKQIKHINNSTISPFVYHFVQDSIVIYGKDSRNEFKFNEIYRYQAIIKSIEKIEEIKEKYHLYQDKDVAQILLYEIAKKLTVIYEILLRNSKKEKKSFKVYLRDIYGNKFQKIRNLVRKKRKWLSLCKKDQKSGEIGFTTLKLRIDRRKTKKVIEVNAEFEELFQTISSFGNKCLDWIDV